MTFLYYQEIPSLVALIFKFVLLGYAAQSATKTNLARLFLAFLVLLSLFNIVELGGMHYYYPRGLDVVVERFGFAYVGLMVLIIAAILHISLKISIDSANHPRWYRYFWLLYLPAVPLLSLLFFTDKLVLGFEPFKDSILRKPGPLYFLFETYVVVYLLASLVNLLYGARTSRSPIIARMRNRLWLLALSPFFLMFMYLILASYVGWPRFTSTFYFPIGITFFLCVTTYAIHEHRLFDIEFYIPWSKVRKRKTAFYGRIRAMIAEVADLGSVNEAVDRLADTLRCPVALVGGPKPVFAAAGGPNMAAMPMEQLRGVDHIIVANEIADHMPQVHTIMKQHGVAAVVPFYPHSENAASWLLLGDSFSEQVYSRLDFRMVEQLFDRMADLFLDKLLAMRTQLAEARSQIQMLQFRLNGAEQNAQVLQQKVEVLSRENTRLAREQPADSLLAARANPDPELNITLLGRDKSMLKQLRERFPQIEQYAGPDSSSFRRRAIPDVLLCEVETGALPFQRKLEELLGGPARRSAVLLFGNGAAEFAYEHRKELRGMLVEVFPRELSPEAMARKVEALVRLRESLTTMAHPDFPLVGCSPAYKHSVLDAARVAGFSDAVCIEAWDTNEAIAAAAYIHGQARSTGEFRVLQTAKLLRHETRGDVSLSTSELDAMVAGTDGGTLMIDNIGALSNETWDQLLLRTNEFENTRLIAACSSTTTQSPASLFKPLHPLVLRLPSLRERRVDLPLLIHYYTLQFNLQAAAHAYLSQADIDDLMATDYPIDLAALKTVVFDRLRAKETTEQSVAAPEIEIGENGKSLDTYVAEFESRLIEQTLARCGGNKSRAARMLNMRPNTLHYKLERYGLKDKG